MRRRRGVPDAAPGDASSDYAPDDPRAVAQSARSAPPLEAGGDWQVRQGGAVVFVGTLIQCALWVTSHGGGTIERVDPGHYDGEIHGEAAGGPVRVVIEHGAGAGLDLSPAQLAAHAAQLAPYLAQLPAQVREQLAPLLARGESWAREAGLMGEDVGRASSVRASADPANVQNAATLALGALAHAPPLDVPVRQALVQYFQRCYGQGLDTDGRYGPATRTALSNILDVLPRNLPPLVHGEAPYSGPPFDPSTGALPGAAPTTAPTTAPQSPPPPGVDAPPQSYASPSAPSPSPSPPAGPPTGPGGTVPVAPPDLTQPSAAPSGPTAPPVAPPPPVAQSPQIQPLGPSQPAPPTAPSTAPSAPMPRDQAAQNALGPLTNVLGLVDVLSGSLPLRNAGGAEQWSGIGTNDARAFAPYFDRITALLQEAGAQPVLPSRNADFWNPRETAVQLMGIEIVGDLAPQASSLLMDARALADSQARSVIGYTMAHPGTGIVTRIRDAVADLVRAVHDRIATIYGGVAQGVSADVTRLFNWLRSWEAQAAAELTNLTNALGGVAVAAAVGGAGFLLLLLLGLIVLSKR